MDHRELRLADSLKYTVGDIGVAIQDNGDSSQDQKLSAYAIGSREDQSRDRSGKNCKTYCRRNGYQHTDPCGTVCLHICTFNIVHCIMCGNLRDHRCRCCTCQGKRDIDQRHIISVLGIQGLDHVLGSTLDIHDTGIHITVDISVYIINKSTENDRHDDEHDITHYMTHTLIYRMAVIDDPFPDDLTVYPINDQHKDQRRSHTCSGTHGSTCRTPAMDQIHISCCGKMLDKYM